MAIRNTSHDGPSACLTSPECNSVKILRMPNLRAVPAARQKSLATLNDMRMLGRERERDGVCYFSHLCTFGATILDKIDLQCIILELSSRYGSLLEHRGSYGPAIMYSNTIKFQLYTADGALAVDHDVAELALW